MTIEVNGKVTTIAQLSGIIDSDSTLGGAVAVGGTIIGASLAERGLKGNTGEKGETGETGNGIASIAKTSTAGLVDTYTITYTDGNTKTFTVTNGEDGTDGHTPTITASKVGNTTTVYVDGTSVATIDDGVDGTDGYSPSASVSKVGDTATITITDENGTTTASITDGADGDDGYSPSASVSKVGDTATITITDKDGTTTASISDGDTNVQSDWNEADSTADDFIKNKPSIPSATSTTPKMDGTAAVGSETTWAKGDHVHPTDTSRAASSHTHTKSDVTDFSHTHTKSDVTDFSHTHTKSEITDFPSLATVATSGSYTDLSSKPDIHNVPSGGTSGQVLAKDSNDDYDVAWVTQSGGGAELVYATSSDSASTVSKSATIVSGSLTTLTSGVQAVVKFSDTNTASSPTLNIGSTGAKSIKRYGTTAVGQNANESWVAGSPVLFVYDGTNWVIVGWINTTYSGGTSSAIVTGTVNLNYIWSPKQIHDGITGLSSKVQIVRWT